MSCDFAITPGSKASGIDELPYALELEPLNREVITKSRMRSLSGNNPPWTSIIRSADVLLPSN